MIKLPVHEGVVHLLESLQELSDYFERVEDNSLLTFDWETTGLNYDAIPLGLALHHEGTAPVFAPFSYFFTKGLQPKKVIELCNQHFKGKRLIGHNTKFDDMISVMQGIKDENSTIFADTLVMVHLVDPELEKKLEKRVAIDFKYAKKSFDEICGKKWDKINWATEGDSLLHLLAAYAGEDTYWETQLYKKYSNLMDEDAWRIHDRIEIPMSRLLRDMKIRGIKIDVPLLKSMGSKVEVKLAEYINEVYETAGCVFNLNSSKQKSEIFFGKLKLPVLKLTKTGAASTDSETMQAFADAGYPIGKAMVKYSELQKLNSGYILSIPELVDDDNVLRGDINSCGTKTGRASSSNPNLQNQPNNYDFPIRKAFIPRDGYVFLNYDYSQLELRVMAHMSKDEIFTQCFKNNEDPHGDVAKRLHITRAGAKVVNFGVLYGMGPDNLANTLGCSKDEAQKIITKDFMQIYTGFAKWKKRTEEFVEKNGYIKNLFGRKRLLKDAFNPKDKKRYYSALRKSVNSIIQGTGADIVKIAMLRCAERFKEEGVDAHLLLQVHDELLIEAAIPDMIRAEQIVIECMETSVMLDVPMLVDGKIIENWSEMKGDTLSLPFRFNYPILSGLLTV